MSDSILAHLLEVRDRGSEEQKAVIALHHLIKQGTLNSRDYHFSMWKNSSLLRAIMKRVNELKRMNPLH